MSVAPQAPPSSVEAQHGSPAPPQTTHVWFEQTIWDDPTHVVPWQHACPAPPHDSQTLAAEVVVHATWGAVHDELPLALPLPLPLPPLVTEQHS
jgi:hypothetical protein